MDTDSLHENELGILQDCDIVKKKKNVRRKRPRNIAEVNNIDGLKIRKVHIKHETSPTSTKRLQTVDFSIDDVEFTVIWDCSGGLWESEQNYMKHLAYELETFRKSFKENKKN